MTDLITNPSDVCPESRDSDQPTGFQLAVGTLGIPVSQHLMMAQRPEFGAGWEAGVEDNLTDNPPMPLGVGLDAAVGRKAWLVGFIAGIYSRHTDNSSTPFCITPHPDNQCPNEA